MPFIHSSISVTTLSAPTVSTACTPTGTVQISIAGTTVTSTCPSGSNTPISTITCPSGTTVSNPPGSNFVNCTNTSITTNAFSISVACSDGIAPLFRLPAGQAITASCSDTSTALSEIFYQVCAPGLPATLIIPYPLTSTGNQILNSSGDGTEEPSKDLYGNKLSLPPVSCLQSNTFTIQPSVGYTTIPIHIGTLNVCARTNDGGHYCSRWSLPLAPLPAPMPQDPDFTSPLFGPTTITLLPRSQPSVAW